MASMTIDFEENDFSDFDTAPVGSSLTINTDAGHIGTYGLEIDMAGTFTTTGVETTALSGSFTQLRTGAWMNIDNLTLSTSKLTQFLTFLHDSSDMGSIRLRENGSGTIQILVTVQDDSGSDGQIISIPSGWFHVEVIVTQASTAVSNDGVYEIKINGTQEYIDSTVDNYNYIADMSGDDYEFRLYPIAAESGVSGSLYVDHIQWNDDNTETYVPPVTNSHIWHLDAASTWQNIGDPALSAETVRGLIVKPSTDLDTILAMADDTLQLTEDGGDNWTDRTTLTYNPAAITPLDGANGVDVATYNAATGTPRVTKITNAESGTVATTDLTGTHSTTGQGTDIEAVG